MPPHTLLQDLVVVYAIAVALLVAAGRLRVPAIVALIAAGILAGPSGLGVVQGKGEVDLLAEIGIALLLFTAGLDFSIAGLRNAWRGVLIGGLLQVVLTAGVVAGLVMLVPPVSAARATLIALFVALSSTAIVIKELTQRNQAHASHGRLVIGILLLQDLIVIAVLALVPVLFASNDMGPGAGAILLRLGAVLCGVVVVGRLALPVLLRLVSTAGREAFSVSILLASIGTAWITSALGLSMAVGAFLAGLVLAESEFSHQIYSEVRPLRDLLASLFFISVGLMVDPVVLLSFLPSVVGIALGMIAIKFFCTGVALSVAGTPLRVAAAGAIVLAQVGEFSLLLGREAARSGILSANDWQVLLGATLLTMMAAPGLVGAAPAMSAWLLRGRSASPPEPASERRSLRGHVVILGYGVGGRLVARALRDLATPYVILDLNGAAVREGLTAGEPIRFADATGVEALEAAGVAEAAAVVGVLSDPEASQRAVRAARTLSATVPLIMRVRYRREAERLQSAGATLAVAEELEASLELLAQLLARLEMPGNVVDVLLDNYRDSAVGEARRPQRVRSMPLEAMPPSISSVPVASHRLEEGAWAVGRTLGDVDVRARTGATVMAVRRAGRTVASPGADFELASGDDIYLLGDEVEVRLARARFLGAPPRS